MATYVNLRGLNRSAPVRVTNAAGITTKLSTTADVKVDLDDANVRRQLNRHSSIGQYVVSGAFLECSAMSGANTGTIAAGSAFTLATTAGIPVGSVVTGSANIPANTTVTEVTNGTQIKLSNATTGTVANTVLLTFS